MLLIEKICVNNNRILTFFNAVTQRKPFLYVVVYCNILSSHRDIQGCNQYCYSVIIIILNKLGNSCKMADSTMCTLLAFKPMVRCEPKILVHKLQLVAGIFYIWLN